VTVEANSARSPDIDTRKAFRELMAGVASAARGHDWGAAVAGARSAAALAEELADPDLLFRAAKALNRLDVFDHAWELYRARARIRWMRGKPEWDGRGLPGRTLLIGSDDHQIGALLRYARLIGLAVQHSRARKCIVLTEDKLIRLLGRSFPEVDFRVMGRDDASALAEADAVAAFETLCTLFANDRAAIVRTFVPLRADPVLTAQLRKRYRDNRAAPAIGIGWWSRNAAKDVPAVADWVNFLDGVPATFVSLQYGDTAAANTILTSALGSRFIVDATADPLGDRDRFAAQIAALDAVVTVPQTCADLAGALDVPTIALFDDIFHLGWSQIEGGSPWYPRAKLLRKRGRPWSAVFEDAASRLAGMIALNLPP
jgi:hypothetical protein